ncbi:MAG TPA: MmcQ/YjbR family DNA-binding protein [Rhizomicrobium sp.]|jgi:predicted DNA-binding protein (MmcQ/YjbR family)|nr:MmcQ/YjbR family DNA-binding protein [Rhizomicrobium sp.]
MTTAAEIRKLALALAGVEEKSHFGTPSFRVNGKMFVEAGETEGIFKLSKVHQEILFETRPQTFRPAIWGAIRWARIALRNVEAREIAELVREAYDEVTIKPMRKRDAKRKTTRR